MGVLQCYCYGEESGITYEMPVSRQSVQVHDSSRGTRKPACRTIRKYFKTFLLLQGLLCKASEAEKQFTFVKWILSESQGDTVS